MPVHALDPAQREKRVAVSGLGILLLVAGAVVATYGLYTFGSCFFRPSSEFFADSGRFIDETRQASFRGILCMTVGAPVASLGLVLVILARLAPSFGKS